MAAQKHHMGGHVNEITFAQSVQMFGEREGEKDLHQLGGLECSATNIDPCPSIYAAASLNAHAEQ